MSRCIGVHIASLSDSTNNGFGESRFMESMTDVLAVALRLLEFT